MPFIENCAASDIPESFHCDPGPNSMLIQITDPASWVPTPKHKFKEQYHFEFLDIDDDDDPIDPKMFISEEQSKELVKLLKHALKNDMNIIVHCFAGICRSGAVVEVASHIGFDPIDKFRSPNTRVMRLMMSELGIPYEVKPHNWRNDYITYLNKRS